MGLAAAYTYTPYAQTIMDGDAVRPRAGDSVGSIPVVPSPWNITAYAEYTRALTDRCHGSLVAKYIFHSRNNGPFYSLDPQSPNYDPGKTPDPSNNLLNLRASLAWSKLEWRLWFLDDALEPPSRHSCASNAYVGSTFFVATTFRPRALGTSLHLAVSPSILLAHWKAGIHGSPPSISNFGSALLARHAAQRARAGTLVLRGTAARSPRSPFRTARCRGPPAARYP